MIFFVRNIVFVTAMPLSITISPAGAAITRAPILTDHMVLQQEMRVPMWGTIDPYEAITVTFPSQSKTVMSDDPFHADGLPAMDVKTAPR